MKIAIVSAHPDDEILGAGGTLLNHSANGDKLIWIIVTNILVENGYPQKEVAERQNEIEQIRNRLNIYKLFKLDLPTMSLDSSDLPVIIQKISAIFKESRPEVVYLPNHSDVHSDHRIVFDATWSCTKSFRFPSLKKVLMYECLSETEFAPPIAEKIFLPNYYIDITAVINEKLELMELYKSEIGPHPFPRSLENVRALATLRGATAGVKYAEAFHLLKFIEKNEK